MDIPIEIEVNANSNELVRGQSEFIKDEFKENVKIASVSMNFLELSKSRRSIRKFKDADVTKEQLMKLIEAAQSAPSAGNCQPWHFYVVKDKKIQAELKANACNQDWILSAPACIVVCTDCKRNESRYGERGRNLYSIQDTAAAIQNILLCAKNMGLGTCWIGAFDEAKVSEILKMPESFRPIAIIPVGYPSQDSQPQQNRRDIAEIVTFVGL